jgi:multicomponent Na+:H+ antiporter subunit D
VIWPAELPPFVIFYVAAALAAVTRGGLRAVILLSTPLLGAAQLLGIDAGVELHLTYLGYELTPYRVDRLSLLFGYLFHLGAFLAIVFSLHVRDTLQHVAGLCYAGSALGAVFAGDLITLFVFWELLAISSVFLIWARRSERALAAGFRYLMVQMLSGVLLLAGALLHLQQSGSLQFSYLGLEGLSGWLIFLAFGIKCAFPLLHSWLTDAYPEATPTGTVLLSAMTTKVAVYALARGFPGTELLIYIGVIMTCFPIFYAVIENDLRRVLGYSMINQIGFMVCGIGIGSQLALNGAVAHAFNEVIFKGLLLMSMGAVLHVTGRINGSDLGGLYRTMPRTTTLCIVGAASISAFPLFSGFVSKAMIMSAVLKEGHDWAWLLLLFASAGVFHHAGIKIPYFAFFAQDRGIAASEPPVNMLLAMSLAALLCILIGSYPWVLYELLPFPVAYQPYTFTHVISQLQLLFFAALAFVWLNLRGLYPAELRALNLDADWTYRRLLPLTVHRLVALGQPLDAAVRRWGTGLVRVLIRELSRHHAPQGQLARDWPTGSMVLWVTVLLGAYLLAYLFEVSDQ